jgi:iron complex transport system ATP-binding protein
VNTNDKSGAEQPKHPQAAAGAAAAALAPAIAMRGVGVFRAERWILRDVNWQVSPGTLAAILGPNGSGKSTLARIAACHLWPTAGQCTILGNTFGQANLPELRKQIRLVQAAGPYDVDPALTAREVVVTGFFGSIGLYQIPSNDMIAQAERVLSLLGLHSVVDQTYGSMSSGERMRSLIARALVTRPAMLILDEPTAGLDPLAREQVLATIQMLLESGHAPTILLITHHVEELPPATSQVLLLESGRPAASGSLDEVLQPDILSKTFGFPVTVRQSGGRFYLEVHPNSWKELCAPAPASPIKPAR